MLRHSCGYARANKGQDFRLIQDWLGHRDPKHTSRYTRVAARGSMALRLTTIGAAFLSLSMVNPWASGANAEEWESRGGTCFDWAGRWALDRDPSGMWVGKG
jgi:hypothetical protein